MAAAAAAVVAAVAADAAAAPAEAAVAAVIAAHNYSPYQQQEGSCIDSLQVAGNLRTQANREANHNASNCSRETHGK